MPNRRFETRQACLLVAAMVAGFAAGVAIPDGNRDGRNDGNSTATISEPAPASRSTSVFKQAGDASSYRSTDTLDDLLALPEHDISPRLALWLVDADPGDLEACWHALSAMEKPNPRLLDLLFLHWTSGDPWNAIRAAAGSKHAYILWWAWAKNDPKQAFHYARENQPNQLGAVLRGIGQSDGELALRLLNAHPEIDRKDHFYSILDRLARTDPATATKLAFDDMTAIHVRPLQAWLREDPHAALAWYAANRSRDRHSLYSTALVSALERENPELLPELVASLPAGNLRRRIESAAFRQLVRTDVAEALRQARETSSRKVARDMLAEVASATLTENPAHALDLFAEVLERSGGETDTVRIKLADGFGGSSWRFGPTDKLLQNLVRSQPEAALDAATAAHGWSQITGKLAEQWAQLDLEAYKAWTETIKQAEVRGRAIYFGKKATEP